LPSNAKMVEVYKARTEMEAEVIKGLLESFGIASVLQSNSAPSVHMFTLDGLAEVRVMVLENVAEQAKALIVSDKNEAV